MKIIILTGFYLIMSLTEAHDEILKQCVSVLLVGLIAPKYVAYPIDYQDYVGHQRTTPKKETVLSRPAKLRKCYMECIDETHARPSLVRMYTSGMGRSNDPSLKNWALCVLRRMDLMSAQGVFRYDTAMAQIPIEDRDIVDAIIDRCLSKKAKPPHEIAWRYLSCYKKRDRKRRFPTLGIFY